MENTKERYEKTVPIVANNPSTTRSTSFSGSCALQHRLLPDTKCATIATISLRLTGMANASEIGPLERMPRVACTKDRKHFTDFGASARREDGKPVGGNMLELAARIEGDKAEVLR